MSTKQNRSHLDGKVLTDSTEIPLYKLEQGTHTFTVKAIDLAGNSSIQSVDFQVKTSYAALEELVQRFADEGTIDNKGIANSLLKKLQKQNLSSFISEVHAQKGIISPPRLLNICYVMQRTLQEL